MVCAHATSDAVCIFLYKSQLLQEGHALIPGVPLPLSAQNRLALPGAVSQPGRDSSVREYLGQYTGCLAAGLCINVERESRCHALHVVHEVRMLRTHFGMFVSMRCSMHHVQEHNVMEAWNKVI